MRENSALTTEINTLRRELKGMGEEAAISSGAGAGGMDSMLLDAGMGGNGNSMQEEALWREAELQQMQINEMTAALQALQAETGMVTAETAGKMRPGSRERLAPISGLDNEPQPTY